MLWELCVVVVVVLSADTDVGLSVELHRDEKHLHGSIDSRATLPDVMTQLLALRMVFLGKTGSGTLSLCI